MKMRGLFARGLAAAFVTAALWGPLGGSGASAQAPPPCDPSLPCRLSVNLPEFPAATIDFQFAPNSERVVFIHVDDGPVRQLYSAPVAGGESPTKLNVPAVDQIHDVAISPDSTRVVYSASEPESPERHLFSVPITGPASANVRLASNVAVSRAQISPDSRKVVFQPATGERLHAVPIAGPANAGVRLTAPVVVEGTIGDFAISANSRSVVYMAQQDTVGVTELYRVPLTLSPQPDPPTVKLNAPLPDGGSVRSFQLAANNGPVVYLASQETAGVDELYSVRLGGGGRGKLSRPLPTGWRVGESSVLIGDLRAGYTIVPDGTRAVYEIQEILVPTNKELYSVPIAGPASASVRLDDPPSETTREFGYQVSADSAWVVYAVADDNSNTSASSVPVAGPASASVPVTLNGEVFTLSPDSAHVVWQLGLALFSTPIPGPLADSVRLNGDEEPQGGHRWSTPQARASFTRPRHLVRHLAGPSVTCSACRSAAVAPGTTSPNRWTRPLLAHAPSAPTASTSSIRPRNQAVASTCTPHGSYHPRSRHGASDQTRYHGCASPLSIALHTTLEQHDSKGSCATHHPASSRERSAFLRSRSCRTVFLVWGAKPSILRMAGLYPEGTFPLRKRRVALG